MCDIKDFEIKGNTLRKYTGTSEQLTIPQIEIVGQWAFEENTHIRNVVIPEGVKELGTCAFVGCSSLEYVKLPSTLEIIGQSFDSCKALKSISIPGALKEIPSFAFSKCASLTNVIIAHGVEIIAARSFEECTALESITIPRSIKEIGNDAFDGCVALRDIYYEGTLDEWMVICGTNCLAAGKTNLYLNGEMLTDVVFSLDHDVSNYPALSGCASLQTVSIPNGVTIIPCCCFEKCTALRTVVLPDTITQIANDAFMGCSSLKKVNLSFKSARRVIISSGAFKECPSLNEVKLSNRVYSYKLEWWEECFDRDLICIIWLDNYITDEKIQKLLRENHGLCIESIIKRKRYDLLNVFLNIWKRIPHSVMDALIEVSISMHASEVIAQLLEYRNKSKKR